MNINPFATTGTSKPDIINKLIACVDDISHGSISGLGTFEGEEFITLRAIANSGGQVS